VQISEAEDSWTFSFKDGVVTALEIDFRFILRLMDHADGQVVNVVIEAPFSLEETGKARQLIVPEQTASLAAALYLFNAPVESASVDPQGLVRVCFSAGLELEVPSLEAYEAWQILTDGCMLVGGPGGRVSVFRDRHPSA
jgi:hypothetical protein